MQPMCPHVVRSSRAPAARQVGSTTNAKKRKRYVRERLRELLPRPSEHLFEVYRLVLCAIDKDRAVYGLKENALAKCLAAALSFPKTSEERSRLLNWRKSTGPGAGILARVVEATCAK